MTWCQCIFWCEGLDGVRRYFKTRLRLPLLPCTDEQDGVLVSLLVAQVVQQEGFEVSEYGAHEIKKQGELIVDKTITTELLRERYESLMEIVRLKEIPQPA